MTSRHELLCRSRDQEGYLVYIQGIAGALSVCVTVASAIGFIRDGALYKPHKRFKLFSWLTTLVSCVSPFLFVSSYSAMMDCEYTYGVIYEAIIGMIMYALQISLVLIIFSVRLVNTFSNTLHAMSHRFKLWLVAVIALLITGALTILLILVVNLETEEGDMEVAVDNALIGAIVFGLFDVLNGVILLVVFVRKLTTVIGDANAGNRLSAASALSAAEAGGAGSSLAGGGAEDVVSDEALISDMSKYTILVVAAMSSTTLMTIFPVIMFAVDLNIIYLSTMASIDSFVNSLCLMLQFRMADNVYLVFCTRLHTRCVQRHRKQVDKYVDKQNDDDVMLPQGKTEELEKVEMRSVDALRM